MQVCSGRDAGDSPFAWVKPNKQMSKIINNLEEFLAWRGFKGESPYYWARCFYKYTDCGPWAVFLVRDAEAFDEEHEPLLAKIRNHKGQAVLENPEDLDDKFVQFLGFDEHGLSKKERGWDTYVGLVEKFIADEKSNGPSKDLVIIRKDGSTMELQRPSYTESHPADYREIYYEDVSKDNPVDLELCAGIKFGSIVEGSEACSGPFTHMFPFSSDDWDRDEEYMEGETSFYWERDNGSWYTVTRGEEEWVAVNAWGDIRWKGETPPEDIRKAAEQAMHNDWQDDPDFKGCIVQTIPVMPGIYEIKPEHKDWKPLPLGETGAEIYSFTNDEIYD